MHIRGKGSRAIAFMGTPQEAAATRTAAINAMDGHVLGKAVPVARFHRQ